jgi:hypothetical protein
MPKLPDEKLLKEFYDRLERSRSNSEPWRSDARESYDFYHGKQWDYNALEQLTKQNRPAITFNRIQPFVKIVVGTMIQTRGEPKFIPRTVDDGGLNSDDSGLNDMLNEANRWIRDTANSEHFEIKAIKDMVISGMGWTDERISYDDNPDGGVKKERIFPLEMYWDPAATEMNLVDARYVMRVKFMDKDEAVELFDLDPEDFSTQGEEGIAEKNDNIPYNDEGVTSKARQNLLAVYEYQYRQREQYFRVDNFLDQLNQEVIPPQLEGGLEPQITEEDGLSPDIAIESDQQVLDEALSALPFEQTATLLSAQQIQEQEARANIDKVLLNLGLNPESVIWSVSKQEFDTLEEAAIQAGITITSDKGKRWQYYRAFITGKTVAEHKKAFSQKGFSFNAITGEYNDEEGRFYGIVNQMKDPARYANKAFSQLLHAINSNPKGGIIYEEGAVSNPAKFEEQYLQSNSAIRVKDGALQSRRIENKATPQLPTGYEHILGLATGAMTETTGINLELLGQRNVAQAGILEATRIQQGMTVLAEMLDSIRLYAVLSARQTIEHIRQLVDNHEGRLIRIMEGQARFEPLLKDNLAQDYDVIIEQIPSSVNQETEDFKSLSALLDTGKVPLTPLMQQAILEKAPIRKEIKDQLIQESLQAAQPNPQAEQLAEVQVQLEIAEKQANIAKTQADAALKQAQAAESRTDATSQAVETQADLFVAGLQNPGL